MKSELILIGAGGHARSCIDVIEAQGQFSIVGLVDRKERVGSTLLGYPIIGSDEDLEVLVKAHKNFLICVGHVKSAATRVSIFFLLNQLGAVLPTIISPTARVSKHAVVGVGTIVMHQAVVNAGVEIGANCIINTGAIVEHDTVVEDCSHLSTACVVNGGCRVGRETFIGSNSSLREGITVGPQVTIASQSAVVCDLAGYRVYAGVPAREMGGETR